MKKIERHMLSLMVVLVLVAIPTLVVFAKELGQLDISGPGIDGQLTLTDHEQMMSLEKSGFFDQMSAVKAPENLGTGYNITAHLNLDGKLVPFFKVVYYPMEEGQAGYWHIVGRLNGETMRTEDQWGQLSPTAESAFRDVMAANEIALQPSIAAAPPVVAQEAAPAVVPVTSSAAPLNPYLIAGVVTAILILIGAGLALRRRTVAQRSA